ncbi:MAG: methyltransferase domain-containing protein [Alphaproteobacteria bacterium]|nr:methyltransferase domain-containing protein [Alphaproteobacteria bacterium]
MRASMAANESGERCKSFECIWGDPSGFLGGAALTAMAIAGGRQNKAALDLLAPRLGDSVIELGCGPGMGVRAALKRVGREGFVAGIDQSATAAHYAAHAVHGACLDGRAAIMRAEAADLPFRDSMFDRAFAVNTFQFWPDPARALREIARVLAPGGRLVITQRASNLDNPTNFAGAANGMERISRATALLKAQGWRIVDERCTTDGPRLLAVSVLAERPV